MDVLRVVDAYCASCLDVRPHTVHADDPSSCFCDTCGTGQVLVRPIDTTCYGSAPRAMRGPVRRDAAHVRFQVRPRQQPWEAADVAAGLALLAEAARHAGSQQDDVLEILQGVAHRLHAHLAGRPVVRRHPAPMAEAAAWSTRR